MSSFLDPRKEALVPPKSELNEKGWMALYGTPEA